MGRTFDHLNVGYLAYLHTIENYVKIIGEILILILKSQVCPKNLKYCNICSAFWDARVANFGGGMHQLIILQIFFLKTA